MRDPGSCVVRSNSSWYGLPRQLGPRRGARLRAIHMNWLRRSYSTSPRIRNWGSLLEKDLRGKLASECLVAEHWTMRLCRAWPERDTWSHRPGKGIGVGCIASWVAGKGGDLGVLTLGIAVSPQHIALVLEPNSWRAAGLSSSQDERHQACGGILTSHCVGVLPGEWEGHFYVTTSFIEVTHRRPWLFVLMHRTAVQSIQPSWKCWGASWKVYHLWIVLNYFYWHLNSHANESFVATNHLSQLKSSRQARQAII